VDKTIITVFLGFLVCLLVSCSSTSTNFTAYKENTIFLGHGGAVRSVNGIEFWMDGSPDRKFKIIGVIAIKQGGGQRLPLPGMLNTITQLPQLAQSSPESHLASEAKAHGGDAVIIIQHNQTHNNNADSASGTDLDYGTGGAENSNGDALPKHSHSTKAYIIKYVDNGN
jgi:hypothetical protein